MKKKEISFNLLTLKEKGNNQQAITKLISNIIIIQTDIYLLHTTIQSLTNLN